ncbi:Proline-rich protein, Y-linked [Plecturocebus cupreus]
MKLETIVLSKLTREQKTKHRMFSLIKEHAMFLLPLLTCNIHHREVFRQLAPPAESRGEEEKQLDVRDYNLTMERGSLTSEGLLDDVASEMSLGEEHFPIPSPF